VTDRRVAVIVGCAAWAGVATLYAVGLRVKGRADIGRALLYNLPIALLFLVHVAHLVIKVFRMGPSAFLRRYAGILAVWTTGGVILYLRLISKSLEVSGHLAWLPLLTLQAWMEGLSVWLTALGVAATLSAAYLKFVVFQGPSGVPGLLVGLLLALALAFGARVRTAAGEQQDAADEVRGG
jgi:hypothetical protein